MANKDIYSLALHEDAVLADGRVRRVPGGWIYGLGNGLVFVPWHNEFQTPDISVPIAAEDYQPPKVREAKRS